MSFAQLFCFCLNLSSLTYHPQKLAEEEKEAEKKERKAEQAEKLLLAEEKQAKKIMRLKDAAAEFVSCPISVFLCLLVTLHLTR